MRIGGDWRRLNFGAGRNDNLFAFLFRIRCRRRAPTTDMCRLPNFHGGRVYKYFRIPPEMAEGLATASSPGGWFWQNLRGAPFERE